MANVSQIIQKTTIFGMIEYLKEAIGLQKPLEQPSLKPYTVAKPEEAMMGYISNIYLGENTTNQSQQHNSIDLNVLKKVENHNVMDFLSLEKKIIDTFSAKKQERMSFADFFDHLLSAAPDTKIDSSAAIQSKEIVSQNASKYKLKLLDISSQDKENRYENLVSTFCYVFYGSLLTRGVKQNVEHWLKNNAAFQIVTPQFYFYPLLLFMTLF